MESVITALLPAIGTLAQWLVQLLINRVQNKQQLVNAKFAIKQAVTDHKIEAQRAKMQRGFGTVGFMFAVSCALVISLLAFRASADPITTNAGKSSTIQAVIPSGGQTSAAIDLGAFTLVGINVPPTFTGTALTFFMSNSINGPWVPVYNQSGPVTYTVAQNRYYAMSNITDFQGVRYLQVVSGSVEAAARTLTLSIKTQY